MQGFSDKLIFRLSCLLSGGIAMISWLYNVLLLNVSVLSVSLRCLLFVFCLVAATKPRSPEIPLYKKWLTLSRRSHWYFLITPGFIIVLCSLLNPFRLPTGLTGGLLSAGGYLLLYMFLLCILFISGWDKRSPDLLQCQQKRKEAE